MLYACCRRELQRSNVLGAKLHAQFSTHAYATKKVTCRLAKGSACMSELY